MKFCAMVLTAIVLQLAVMSHSFGGFELSIGNIAVTGSGGSFTVFATTVGQDEQVSSYNVKLNLTGQSGSLPVILAKIDGTQATGFLDTTAVGSNTLIENLNGAGSSDTSQLTGFSLSAVSLTQNSTVALADFSFTVDGGTFSPGKFIDVGFVTATTADTAFGDEATPVQEIPFTVIGGTGMHAAAVATSTRIAAGVVAIPEPGALGVLGIAGALVTLRRRRNGGL